LFAERPQDEFGVEVLARLQSVSGDLAEGRRLAFGDLDRVRIHHRPARFRVRRRLARFRVRQWPARFGVRRRLARFGGRRGLRRAHGRVNDACASLDGDALLFQRGAQHRGEQQGRARGGNSARVAGVALRDLPCDFDDIPAERAMHADVSPRAARRGRDAVDERQEVRRVGDLFLIA
jgi:hypothetical protein